MTKTKCLITVSYMGRIPTLYQDGPIVNPIWVGVQQASFLIGCGYKVYEHNPKNTSEKILLTNKNLYEENFPAFIPKVKAPVEGASSVTEIKAPILPTPDRTPAKSAVVDQIPVTEVPDTNASEKKESDQSVKKEDKVNMQKSLKEQAIELGIDPEGMTRNKLRAAIAEAKSKQEDK